MDAVYKRILSLLVAATVAFLACITVSADVTGSFTVIGSYYMTNGSLKLSVSLEHVSGVLGAEATVKYDKDQLRLVSVTDASDRFVSRYSINEENGTCRLFFYTYDAFDGTLSVLDLQFELVENVANENISVVMTECILSDGQTDYACGDHTYYGVVARDETHGGNSTEQETEDETKKETASRPQTSPPEQSNTEPVQSETSIADDTAENGSHTTNMGEISEFSPDMTDEGNITQDQTDFTGDPQGNKKTHIITAVICSALVICAVAGVTLIIAKRKKQ